MDKKDIYKKIVILMKQYRRVCINDNKHDSFLYGYILGYVDCLYTLGVIDSVSNWYISDYIMNKTDSYFNECLNIV